MATKVRPFPYEHVSQPVAQLPRYLQRQLRSLGIGMVLVLIALLAGMVGYHRLVALSWIDSFLNASMILSGMGPIAAPTTDAGKSRCDDRAAVPTGNELHAGGPSER